MISSTRNTARAWLFAHVPPGSGVVLEPFLPKEASAIGNHWLVPGPPSTARKAGWARHWRLPHFHYQRTGLVMVAVGLTLAAITRALGG